MSRSGLSEKAKAEITVELAAVRIQQTALRDRALQIEQEYEAGLISHPELVTATVDLMERQRELLAIMERMYR